MLCLWLFFHSKAPLFSSCLRWMNKWDTKISPVVLINFFFCLFLISRRSVFGLERKSEKDLGHVFHKRTLINTLLWLLFIMFLLPLRGVNWGEGGKRDGDGIELFALMSLKRKPRQKTLPLKRNEEARNTPNKGCRFSPLFKRGRKFISFRLF